MLSDLSLTELLLSGVALTFLIYLVKSLKPKDDLPSGPWGFPIVGHVPFFGNNPAKKFMEWRKTYGPIFRVRFGSVPIFILNDIALIREAFNMEEFSGRPRLPVYVQMTGGKGFGFVDGPDQIEQRKFAVATLKEHSFSRTAVEFRTHAEFTKLKEKLKSWIKEKPGQPMAMKKMFQSCIANVMWDAMFGTTIKEEDNTIEHLVAMIDQGADTNSSVISQMFWFFPWVCHVGNFFNYNPPVEGFKTVYDFIRKQLKECKKSHVVGQQRTFTDAYFDKVAETTDINSSFHESKGHQPVTTGDIFIGASDTTTVVMDWAMIYLALNPHFQEKLQEEIDTVIGGSDATLTDRVRMPFTEAVITETFRRASIAAFAVFHRATKDVTFQEYRFPEGTVIIGNLWATLHNPEIWDEPSQFNPMRFIDQNGKLNDLISNVLPFSTGKRMCPGESISRDQLFLLITSFFQNFSVSCTNRPPSLETTFGFVLSPQKFELNVVERQF